MIKDVHFDNMGFLDIVVPTPLFNSLKSECDTALENNQEMESGLSGAGVPIHKFVENKENLKNLQDYLYSLIKMYREKFGFDPSDTKTLTKHLPFKMGSPWINYQKKYQFVPRHRHDGSFAYTIWVNIPYNADEELKNGGSHASTFDFSYLDVLGGIRSHRIKLNKTDNGRMLFFPATMMHQVYPFYTSDDYRISISGNILLDATN